MSLVGASGAGKSTLLALIAGLSRPDRGTVRVDGIDLAELSERRRARVRATRIGIALQSDNLVPCLTALENVEVAIGFAGRRTRREARLRAALLLDRLGVGSRGRQRPRHLSGGEAQRVALAVALANEPALLLADEVVAALDQETAGTVMDQVTSDRCAVLFVTHDITLADRAERRLRIREHRLVSR
ncbi:MAG: ATP-binding cassette domain-containing protein [Nocardioides sp.]